MHISFLVNLIISSAFENVIIYRIKTQLKLLFQHSSIYTYLKHNIVTSNIQLLVPHLYASIAENGLNNVSSVDYPLLNGNSYARYVFTHDRTSGTALDKTLNAYYTGAKWTIYTEDLTPLPEGLKVNIKIIE